MNKLKDDLMTKIENNIDNFLSLKANKEKDTEYNITCPFLDLFHSRDLICVYLQKCRCEDILVCPENSDALCRAFIETVFEMEYSIEDIKKYSVDITEEVDDFDSKRSLRL